MLLSLLFFRIIIVRVIVIFPDLLLHGIELMRSALIDNYLIEMLSCFLNCCVENTVPSVLVHSAVIAYPLKFLESFD